ncbi:MAG: DUF5678 domain-containing protein [Chloroflexota bacterium]
MIDVEEIQEEQARFHQNVEFGQAHYDELLERYPEQWVAIYDEAVVGTGTDKAWLIAELRKQGVPPGHTFFDFFTHDDTIVII